MPERRVEVERRFLAPDDRTPEMGTVAEVVGRARHELEASYYDTLGLTLTAAGWSLRHRQGGHDAGWTLKRPADAEHGRIEVYHPGEASAGIPDALGQEAREITGLEALVPVARLHTTRVESILAVDGAPVATLAQDSVRAATAAGEQTWQEIEAELAPDADPQLLDALSEALIAGGARPADHRSKVSRALAGAPRLDAPAGPGTPARTVMLAWASRQVGTLQAFEASVRTDGPDAVHKARVATRRLRSLLKTFRRLFRGSRTDALRAELRWLGEMLGAPRDAEVLREEFSDLLAELGPDAVSPAQRHHLLGHLDAVHARGHAALVAALDSPRAAALRAALVDLLIHPPLRARADRPAGEVLPGLYRASVEEVRRRSDLAHADPGHLEYWHEVRKAAKATRYAAEALAVAIPGMDAAAARWEAVTEAFGVLQDTAVAGELIDGLAPDAPACGLWDVLRDIQQDRRRAALAAGEPALAAALGEMGPASDEG